MKINCKNIIRLEHFNERNMIKPTLVFPNSFEGFFLLGELEGNYFVFFLKQIIIMKFQIGETFLLFYISYIFIKKQSEIKQLKTIKINLENDIIFKAQFNFFSW